MSPFFLIETFTDDCSESMKYSQWISNGKDFCKTGYSKLGLLEKLIKKDTYSDNKSSLDQSNDCISMTADTGRWEASNCEDTNQFHCTYTAENCGGFLCS